MEISGQADKQTREGSATQLSKAGRLSHLECHKYHFNKIIFSSMLINIAGYFFCSAKL